MKIIKTSSHTKTLLIASLIGILLFFSATGQAQPSALGWSSFVNGGYQYRFERNLDTGGKFSVHRFALETGINYMPEFSKSVGLSFGYGYDGYDFSGSTGFARLNPWGQINTYRLAMPIRWGLHDQLTLFMIPMLRVAAEQNADLAKAYTAGGITGVSWMFSDQLSLGPGIGVITELEDSASVFPILLINWKITPAISLETGRSVGMVQNPGLSLRWAASSQTEFLLGCQYEKLRFRLNKSGPAARGIGEDRNFPLYTGVAYHFSPLAHIAIVGGVDLQGQQRLEDQRGNLIEKSDYKSAPFVAVTFKAKF